MPVIRNYYSLPLDGAGNCLSGNCMLPRSVSRQIAARGELGENEGGECNRRRRFAMSRVEDFYLLLSVIATSGGWLEA